MLRLLISFLPVAFVVTMTPGPATALVIRNAVRGGRREALLTAAGNSAGILVWSLLSAVGISALVAASEAAFIALKVVGAGVLLWLGIRTLRHSRARSAPVGAAPSVRAARTPLREGVVTAMANPKLAVFFIALFPQFVPAGTAVLPAALVMAATVVACDLIWFSVLATVVARGRDALRDTWLARRMELLTGAVLIGLGVRLAFERP